MRYIFLATAFAFTTGCIAGGPPPPSIFQTWAQPGASPERVKAALMDCGYDNPYGGFEQGFSRRLSRKVTIDDIVRIEQCMKGKGFNQVLNGGRTICDERRWMNLPACHDSFN
jgi:hypothetical protein